MSTQIGQAYPLIVDKSGKPLDNGIVYIGDSGQNPENYPIQIYYDEEFSIPAPQPLRTVNGYFSRNGSPAKIFINVAECSIAVKDKFKILQWSDLNYTGILSGAGIKASDVIDESGKTQQEINSDQNSTNIKQEEINAGVNSINDMLGISSPINNDRVFVKSYHEGLNKGGGFFVYDSTRSLENDGGLVINGWIRTGFDSVNAFMFGAIGDGIADDTIAIQKAIDTVNKLNIPTGAYLISAPIKILKSNVHITGDGASSILRQITDDIDTITIGKSDTDVQAITIENLFFTRSGSTDFGSAITCENTLNLTLRNLKTDGMAWSFVFKDKNFGPSVSDCNLYNHKIGGIWWNSTSLVSSGIPATNGLSLIRVNMDNILGVQPTIAGLFWQSGEGVYAVNCEFIRQKVGMLIKPEIAAMSGAHFGKFSNCLFDMCGEHGVMMFPQNGSNIRIISFTECWFSASGLEGVVIVPDATSVINAIGFSNCQFVTNGKDGLYLAQNPNLTDVQVNGGYFLANSAITPNTYSGINNAGMGGGLVINGITSHLGDSGYANNQKHGINIGLGASGFIVTSNYLNGNSVSAINDMSGSVSKIVANNIL
jgi:hypothetical protein